MSVSDADLDRYYEQERRRRKEYEFAKYLCELVAEGCRPIWHQGDGYGGVVRQLLEEAFENAGLPIDPPPRKGQSFGAKRDKIAADVRRSVFERDLYRCVYCATHLNLSIDHIIPWSKGGSNEPQNLQTLCRSCNSRKRDR